MIEREGPKPAHCATCPPPTPPDCGRGDNGSPRCAWAVNVHIS
nr:MAG TPA_asm: hypothetical protein [Caudoviricetes sp.]